MPTRRHGQHMPPAGIQMSPVELAARLEALKKFKPGDQVVICGGISAVFVRGTPEGRAVVEIGIHEQQANPLNLAKSTKTTK